MAVAYLTFLLVSLICMVLCDWRWKLAFFADAKTAAALCVGLVVLFLIWDGLGIATGSFFRGGSDYMTGVILAPELPVEEPIFLFFLSYLTINVTTATRRLHRLWIRR
ncbi:MAG: lycopene cyclase domain-containing protein [Corynebacterium sp.]|uniref:lycopene cyclase domain-containing protein n=1 Tax=Corynebacterium sp. TaxID=1720 RepID=UPI0026DAE077|nr:lycopene cyclase domain-containing protein [Corynebacterium sp.]MDO5099596.1 lycopene cyclase domain-containing protein [Corynebacterium sp.]